MRLEFMKWTRLQLLIAFCAVFDAWVCGKNYDAGQFSRRWGFKDSRHLRAVLKWLALFKALHKFDGADQHNRHHVYYCAKSEETVRYYEEVFK